MIRAATAADLPAVAALFREYAASLGIDLSYQGFKAELAGLPGAYAPPRGCLLLATGAGGAPAGCVALRPLANSACEMKRLYIQPALRGTGAGRALALAAIEEARTAGYRTMLLDTLPDMQTAQALYRALGFVEIDPYYPSPVNGTIFMRKTLDRDGPPDR